MDLGLLFGVIGMAYGLTSKSKTEIPETPKLPDCPQGCHYEYEFIQVGKTSCPVPIAVPNGLNIEEK